MAKLKNLTHGTLNHPENPEVDPHKQLAAVVLTDAYRAVHHKNPVVRAKARYFFTSGSFDLWADMIHREYAVIIAGYHNVIKNGMPPGDKRRERYRKEQ